MRNEVNSVGARAAAAGSLEQGVRSSVVGRGEKWVSRPSNLDDREVEKPDTATVGLVSGEKRKIQRESASPDIIIDSAGRTTTSRLQQKVVMGQVDD